MKPPRTARCAWLFLVFAGLLLQVPPSVGEEPSLPQSVSFPTTSASRSTPASPPNALDGRWSVLSPPARMGMSLVLDTQHNRLIAFGGDDGSQRNDLWALDLTPGATWAPLVANGPYPAARYRHTAVYDPAGDRMVVFGGTAGGALGDCWVLELSGEIPQWTQLAPAGSAPPARFGHVAVLDPVRHRMIIACGFGAASQFSDAWALTLDGAPAWVQLIASGGPATYGLSGIYDPNGDRVLVFGGYPNDGVNWTFALTLGPSPQWVFLSPTGTPPTERAFHTAVYDPVGRRMLVFGGYRYNGADFYFNDTWALALSGTLAWSRPTTSGTLPTQRRDHTAVFDPAANRMIVFSGDDCTALDDHTYALSFGGTATWSQLVPGSRPGGGYNHSSIYDPTRQRIVVFGGHYSTPGTCSNTLRNDTWTLDLSATPPTWNVLTTTGTTPAARAFHSAIYDAIGDRMIVFGGMNAASTLFNDVWALRFSGTGAPAWSQLAPSGTKPSIRFSHTAVYDDLRRRMLVFGGYSDVLPSIRNDTWALSLGTSPTWTRLYDPDFCPTCPPGRYGHAAIYDPTLDRMLVDGGWGGSSSLGDTWQLSLAGMPAWQEILTGATAPPPRVNHAAALDNSRGRMVIYGDFGDTPYAPAAWAMNLGGAPSWTHLWPVGQLPPNGHNDVTAHYVPPLDALVVYGGGLSKTATWILDWSGTVDVPHAYPPALLSLTAWPNPARGGLRCRLTMPRAGHVRVLVHDLAGRRVRSLADRSLPVGSFEVVWDGTNDLGAGVRSGVYFIRAVAGGGGVSTRVVLLR